MNQREVIARFCNLSSKVAEYHGWKHAADCFCGAKETSSDQILKQAFPNDMDYRFAEEIMEFIEQAVQEKMK